MSWIAIRTEPGRLPVVRQLIKRKGDTAYLPAEIRWNHRRRKRIVVPMMPYLFVQCPEPELFSLWLCRVKGVRYVKAVIGTLDHGPLLIADYKIEILRRAIDDWRLGVAAQRAKKHFGKGSTARIKSGPLAGRKGTVAHIRGNRARLEALIFGSVRTVEITLEQLEAA